MPWIGLFNKINNADEFIILDHVTNNPKSPEFWCRRVKMLIGGREHWMSVTLKKDKLNTFVPINTMELEMDEKAIKKFIQSVALNYKRAPFFNEVFYLVEHYFSFNDNNLSRKNTWFIKEVMNKIGINTACIFSSELNPKFSSNEMLIDLLKKRNATVYLCGNGAASYQKDELYVNEGISVKYNQFIHPEYSQFNSSSFIKGLSILDSLMNLGFKGTARFYSN